MAGMYSLSNPQVRQSGYNCAGCCFIWPCSCCCSGGCEHAWQNSKTYRLQLVCSSPVFVGAVLVAAVQCVLAAAAQPCCRSIVCAHLSI